MIKAIIKKEKLQKGDKIIFYLDWDSHSQQLPCIDLEDIPAKVAKIICEKTGITVIVNEIEPVKSATANSSRLSLKKISLKIAASILNGLTWFHRKPERTVLFQDGWDKEKRVVKCLQKTRSLFFGPEYGLSKRLLLNEYSELFKNNFSFKSLDNYSLSKNQTASTDSFISKLREDWADFRENRKGDFEICENTEMWSLVESKLTFLFENFFEGTVKKIEQIENMLRREKVNLVLLNTDVVYENKTLVSVANRLGVNSLVLQLGLLDHPIESLPLTASKIALWGEYNQIWFSKHGVEAEKLVITGCPQFDKYIKKEFFNRQAICKKYGLDNNKHIVTLLTQHANETLHFANLHLRETEFSDFCQKVVEAVEDLSQVQLIIKFHPWDKNADLHRNQIEKMSTKKMIILQNADLDELLNVSDLAITYTSTAGLEAMLLGKPVITVAFEGKATTSPFDSPILPAARTASDFKKEIRLLLENAQFRKEYDAYREKCIYFLAFKQDGQSSKRVGKLIEEMTSIGNKFESKLP
jgi:hypothetical protein